MSEDLKRKAKAFIDANVWDGEDRTGCKGDSATFNPDELQELVNELVDYINSPNREDIDILAKTITDELFSLGDEIGSPTQRIQFIGGSWPDNERTQGGLVRIACDMHLKKILHKIFLTPPDKDEA